MKFSLGISPLLLLAVVAFLGKAEAAETTGYLMDLQCIGLCKATSTDIGCTPDGSNAFYSPEEHTGWCLQLPVCEATGYVLMSEFPTEDDGRHAIVLKLAGDESQNATVEYIEAGSRGAFPKVVVTYDEALSTTEMDEDGMDIMNVFGASIADPWADGDFYSGAPTSQVVCQDSMSPDMEANNMCFRSDVVVSSFESNGNSFKVIESSGCPDHANMMGSNGTIPNTQKLSFIEEESSSNATCSSACNPCGSSCGSNATGCYSGCSSSGCGGSSPEAANCGATGCCSGCSSNGGGGSSPEAGCHSGCDACGADAGAGSEPDRGDGWSWGSASLHLPDYFSRRGLAECAAGCSSEQGCSSGCSACSSGSKADASPCSASDASSEQGCCSGCSACSSGSKADASPCSASDGSSEQGCGSCCSACSAGCGASCGSGYSGPTTVEVGVGITLTYELGSGVDGMDTFKGTVVYEGVGWIAFGLSEDGKMPGPLNVGIIGLPDEETVMKYALEEYGAPDLSENQSLLEGSIEQNETHTVLTFTKYLEEDGEASINKTGLNHFLVAGGGSNTLGYHSVREPFEVMLSAEEAGCNGGCGGGGGTGGCGCGSVGSGSDESSHGVIGAYEPLFQHYSMIIPAEPVVGDATPMSDDVVGILSNGVLLDSHQMTFAYDSCNGHSDKKHQYHYHIPPICVLESMGVSFADSHTWWINDMGNETRAFDELADQFPDTGPASPVIGFARDGFPIFGPYDDAGDLQVSGDLDVCNGKEDSNGNYGYYFSVDPPFAPTCLRGEVGSFSYFTTDIVCPKEGINNQLILADMNTDVSKSVAVEKREKIPVEAVELLEAEIVGEDEEIIESGASFLACISAISFVGAVVALFA